VDMKDAVERAVWTAVEAGLAVLVIADVSSWRAAGIAALAAAIACVKAIAKSKIRSD